MRAVTALPSCSYREKMCAQDEYVVYATEYPDSGRNCVQNGEEPPQGYQRYPEGRVPHLVEEDYNPAKPRRVAAEGLTRSPTIPAAV